MKITLEHDMTMTDLESNDSGWNMSLSVNDPWSSSPVWVEIHSNYPEDENPPDGGEYVRLEHHPELAAMVGKRVRVTIEVVEDP